MSQYVATKQEVKDRGAPPDSFLDQLVAWGKNADPAIFAPNERNDIYSKSYAALGPWTSPLHRKAVMLEVLRVLAGFESSWNWNEGIDTTNEESATPCTEEAGILQCSGNSMHFDPSLRDLLLSVAGDDSCRTFITTSKTNHSFAIEYCARLLRFTTEHHGPVRDNKINRFLSREAVAEFLTLL
ncbi:hypothetical protein ACIPIX_02910 [Pseudomonas protegens]|uniref:hypothetical protein n=1 Tax=Pseudomonas protegens TaxID=380021 RepID=UPI00381BA2A5